MVTFPGEIQGIDLLKTSVKLLHQPLFNTSSMKSMLARQSYHLARHAFMTWVKKQPTGTKSHVESTSLWKKKNFHSTLKKRKRGLKVGWGGGKSTRETPCRLRHVLMVVILCWERSHIPYRLSTFESMICPAFPSWDMLVQGRVFGYSFLPMEDVPVTKPTSQFGVAILCFPGLAASVDDWYPTYYDL